MLDWFIKYRFSFTLALLFHAFVFAFLFVRWQPEAEKTKKIVLKPGDVIEASVVPQQLYQQKRELVERQKAEEKRKKELARKKAEEKRKKELARKKAEEKRKKELARKKAEEKRKKELARKKAEEKRKKELARKKAEEEKRKKELARKKAEEERRKKELARKKAEEERRKKELARKKAEEERRKKELARKKAEEQRRREAEAQRQRELAAEEARLAAERERREKGLVDRYVRLIQNKIARNWITPASVRQKLKSTLEIRMTPGGEVVQVQVIRSSGNYAFDRATEQAVRRASPLPVPKDAKLFNKNFRKLTINYEK